MREPDEAPERPTKPTAPAGPPPPTFRARGARGAHRASSLVLAVLNLSLAAAFVVLYRAFTTRVLPLAEDVPRWVSIGFPVVTLVAVAHFGHRAFEAWRRFRSG